MKKTTKRKLKQKAGQVTNEILWVLRDLAEMVPYPFESKYEHINRLRYYDRYKVSRALGDLTRQGLVKKVRREKKVYYSLTDLGRAKSLKYAYSKKERAAKTNGLSTIVIFDIPEERRKARDFLRRFLKKNGFMMLQRSVFIGRFEIQPEFKELLSELKVDLNVKVLEGRVLYT